MTPRALLVFLCSAMLHLGCGGGDGGSAAPASSDPERFDAAAWGAPSVEYRPWIRWWWPGGAVDPEQVDVELDALVRAGFGGVEVQAFAREVPPADLDRGVLTWGSPGFFASLRAAGAAAQARGLAFDVTLGSAYPAGAPSIREARARQLVLGFADVLGPSTFTGPIPPPLPEAPSGPFGPFDRDVALLAILAAEVVAAEADPPVLDRFRDIRAAVESGGWTVPEGVWRVFAVYENEARQIVQYAAYREDAFVVDHLDRRGAEVLIREIGDPMLDAAQDVDAVFIDSFELSSELPWTDGLLERFRRSKGYDPTPLLPLLFSKGGETETNKFLLGLEPRFAALGAEARVREDYEDVRGAAFLEEHLVPLQEWAARRGVALRVQAHGGFADYIDAYSAVDIPESEGFFAAGSYDFLKLATSAAHAAGRRIVSSESFVGLIQDPRGLDPEDFHLLAGRAMSAGVTRLVHHGFTHRFTLDGGETWYPWEGSLRFASRIDEEHPVWESLPALNEAFARIAYASTRGRHAADLAWLHAGFEPTRQIEVFGRDGEVPRSGESDLSRAILEAGLVYDRVSRASLTDARTETEASSGRAVFRIGHATYPALLIDDLEVATPELLASIEQLCGAGIPVVVIGELPLRARGWADREARDAAVRASVERLASCVRRATQPEAREALLAAGLTPALEDAGGAAFPFLPDRRSIRDGDVILLFNESDEALTRRLRVNLPASRLRVFDPERAGAIAEVELGRERTFALEIPARRSRLIVLAR